MAQNNSVELDAARFTRPARRHRIATGRARHVLENPFVVIIQPSDADHPDPRALALGDDQRGLGLVVGGPVIDRELLIVHVQPLTHDSRYLHLYELGKELQGWTQTL